jgi:hypothetical protein
MRSKGDGGSSPPHWCGRLRRPEFLSPVTTDGQGKGLVDRPARVRCLECQGISPPGPEAARALAPPLSIAIPLLPPGRTSLGAKREEPPTPLSPG